MLNSIGRNPIGYLKKGITPKQARDSLEKAKTTDLNTVCSFLGAPIETGNDMKDTIEFAKELNPTLAQFTVLTLFPEPNPTG